MQRLTRYVALGDSTTEGLQDLDEHGNYRGWADRFAEHMANAYGGIEYANLAVRGQKTRQILDGQLGPALAMRPDIATVVAGVNDLLRPRFDLEEVMADIAHMMSSLKGQGATVITFTMPDLSRVMPLASLLRDRLARTNDRLRTTCRQLGTVCVDLAAHEVAGDPRLWDGDRLHASPHGHERVGMAVADALGLPGYSSWSESLPPQPRPSLRNLVDNELRWSREHLVPWLIRRVRGQSSSDNRSAKRPRLVPVHGPQTSS